MLILTRSKSTQKENDRTSDGPADAGMSAGRNRRCVYI